MDFLSSLLGGLFGDITFLKGIWIGAVALGGLSSFIMIGLIVHRIFVHRRERKRDIRRKALRMRILEYLETEMDWATAAEIFKAEDGHLLREIVMALLGSVRGDSRDRLIALLMIAGVRDGALKELKEGSPIERLDAVEVVTLFPGPETIAALHEALDDDEPHVRLYAAQSLADLDPDFSVREMIEKLDIGGAIRSRMLRDIFRRVGSHDVMDLIHILKADFDDTITTLALYAIGGVQDFSVVPVVADKMTSKSLDVRAEAMRALTAIGHPGAEKTVLKAFEDEEWPVRAQAAICSGRIGFQSAIPHLRRLLGDGEWWARFRAAEALVKLGSDGVKALEREAKGEGRAAQIAGLVLSEQEARS